jgi:DNA-directed RNA polymerase specialized sigma24 family protein
MPEQQRRAILLREWQGLSYREISDELELSQSAVETLIFRARRSLAQGLEQPDLIKKPKRKGFRRARGARSDARTRLH